MGEVSGRLWWVKKKREGRERRPSSSLNPAMPSSPCLLYPGFPGEEEERMGRRINNVPHAQLTMVSFNPGQEWVSQVSGCEATGTGHWSMEEVME